MKMETYILIHHLYYTMNQSRDLNINKSLKTDRKIGSKSIVGVEISKIT